MKYVIMLLFRLACSYKYCIKSLLYVPIEITLDCLDIAVCMSTVHRELEGPDPEDE